MLVELIVDVYISGFCANNIDDLVDSIGFEFKRILRASGEVAANCSAIQ